VVADCAFEIKTPMRLAKQCGPSVYASAREFARTHTGPASSMCWSPSNSWTAAARAAVRRIELSVPFVRQFGRPSENVITLDHPLGRVLLVRREVTQPSSVSLTDLNGVQQSVSPGPSIRPTTY
jgi:hypothetical protein